MKNSNYDECYFLNCDSYDNIHLYEVGCQKCPPNYSFDPIIRNHYILRYIIDGCGTLQLNGKTFYINAGEAFITPPHILVYYQADSVTPWNYEWIHFTGKKAIEMLHQLNISVDSPIFHSSEDTTSIYQCIHEILLQHEREYLCIGNLYHLFQLMFDLSSTPMTPNNNNQLIYIKKTIDYIQHKYFEPIIP